MKKTIACLAVAAAAAAASAEPDPRSGVDFSIEARSKTVDPARSAFVTLKAVAPEGVSVSMPDISSRLKGFSSAEEFAEEPVSEGGTTTYASNWKLVPEPCADEYKIRPFAVAAEKDGEDLSFVAGPFRFDDPAARKPAPGGIEIDPKKDFPPLGWKLAGFAALALLASALVVSALLFALRLLARRVKEHFLSPIERAWAEFGRLMSRRLPQKGRFKDFYVELTMVVRRYVQRRYGIRAPHMTTEEFLRELGKSGATDREKLAVFLESADMVKFAGVEATEEMASGAAESAKEYLKSDSIRSAGKESR